MTANLLTLNRSKTEFLLIRLNEQPAKIEMCPLKSTHFAHNGFIFDECLTLSDHISALSKSCYSHICELCCIWFKNSQLPPHTTLILQCLHRQKNNEHTEYKLLSFTHKVPTSIHLSYLDKLLSVQPLAAFILHPSAPSLYPIHLPLLKWQIARSESERAILGQF